jgi:hypothetical protein
LIYQGGHPDIRMAAGAGRNLLIVVPKLQMVVLRQVASPEGQDDFDTDRFFDLLLDGGPRP